MCYFLLGRRRRREEAGEGGGWAFFLSAVCPCQLSVAATNGLVPGHTNMPRVHFPVALQVSVPSISMPRVTRWIAFSSWKKSKYWPEGQPERNDLSKPNSSSHSPYLHACKWLLKKKIGTTTACSSRSPAKHALTLDLIHTLPFHFCGLTC